MRAGFPYVVIVYYFVVDDAVGAVVVAAAGVDVATTTGAGITDVPFTLSMVMIGSPGK